MLVTFHGQKYELGPEESVLDGMARHGVCLPSACRSGACQACLVRAVTGDPGPDARRGLKATWLASGYFLACLARPSSDLVIARAGEETRTPARLVSVRRIGCDVLRVRVRPERTERPFGFQPGQHLTLTAENGPTRTYSIANLPGEAAQAGIEFHVRVRPGGAMSGWLARARPGAALALGSPAGECFYVPGRPGAPLLLAGTGTGIAPLVAIARVAVAQRHDGPIVLVHGAATRAGLYLGTEGPEGLPRSVRSAVSWRTWVAPAGAGAGGRGGGPGEDIGGPGEDIGGVVARELAALTDRPGTARAYLCGGMRSVHRMRRALFLAGMSLAEIFGDQFTAAGA